MRYGLPAFIAGLVSIRTATVVIPVIGVIGVAIGGETPLAPYIQAHQGASRLMANRTLRLQTAGAVELDYVRGLSFLRRPSLLEDVQTAYANGLPPGETPEFVIRETQTGHYTFVNRHRQHSRIEELFRGQTPEDRFVLVLFVEGERWFGDFESLIRIEVRPDNDNAGCRFRVDVDAYPYNAMLRGLVRLGPVKRYFENKMDEIVGISMGVIASLSKELF